MISRALLLGGAVFVGACATEPSAPERARIEPAIVHTASGASVTLPIDVATQHEVDGTRESFRTADGVVWSVQTLEHGADAPTASLDEIAIALCRRVELGEVEGELTHRGCQFAGQAAQCIESWQLNREGERILRRGAVARAGGDVVWISLAMRERTGGVDGLAEALTHETRLLGAP